ncbi:MAG: hypothetical protein ACLQO1_02640 [Steroidobacteraceae bacterium]|jgi:hypothetical protein
MSKKRKTQKKLDDVLWELSKAISIVVTVYHALERVDHKPDIACEYITLKLGIRKLHDVHEALDLAIPATKK